MTNSHNIESRAVAFDFPETSAPVWNKAKPEWSHMVNGASLAMPYLEPFLIRTMREAAKQLDDPGLLEDARGFIAQEGHHYKNHQRYNERLKENGYAELADIEAMMVEDYKRFHKKSLKWRLAYTAGFETMTIGLTEWLIKDRRDLFAGADPAMASLVLWHMVEETEHKTVAFDVYKALYPKGGHAMRLWGLLIAGNHVAQMSRRAYTLMLKKDGSWTSLRSRMRLWRMVLRFLGNIAPAYFRAFSPSHHPSHDHDPDWVVDWADAYSAYEAKQFPLLDTNHPDIPAKFV